MKDISKRVKRKDMLLPQSAENRYQLREAVAMYLGHFSVVEVDGNPTEAYARIMTAIAKEVEQLINEGKLAMNCEPDICDCKKRNKGNCPLTQR